MSSSSIALFPGAGVTSSPCALVCAAVIVPAVTSMKTFWFAAVTASAVEPPAGWKTTVTFACFKLHLPFHYSDATVCGVTDQIAGGGLLYGPSLAVHVVHQQVLSER